MLKRRIAFFALMALALFMLLRYGGSIYLWIIIFQLAIFIFSIANVAITLASISVDQRLDKNSFERGDHTAIHLAVRSGIPAPFCHLVLHCATTLSALDGDTVSCHASVWPFFTERIDIDMYLPYRGEYEVGVVGIEATDLFGLVSWTLNADFLQKSKRIAKPLRMLVLPRAGGRVDRLLPENDGSTAPAEDNELLRALAEEDDMEAASLDIAARNETTLLLDCSDHGLDIWDAAHLENVVTEAAASLAKRLCGEGRSVRLVTMGSTDEAEYFCAGSEDLPELYAELARVRFGGGAEAWTTLGSVGDAEQGAIAVVTAHPSEKLVGQMLSLSESGKKLTVVICPLTDEYDAQTMRILGEFKMRGIAATVIMPGDSLPSERGEMMLCRPQKNRSRPE